MFSVYTCKFYKCLRAVRMYSAHLAARVVTGVTTTRGLFNQNYD